MLSPTCFDSQSRATRTPKRRKKQRKQQGTWYQRGLKVRNVLCRGLLIEAPLDPGRDGSSGPSNGVRGLASIWPNLVASLSYSQEKSLCLKQDYPDSF